jgi:hypothetical protein
MDREKHEPVNQTPFHNSEVYFRQVGRKKIIPHTVNISLLSIKEKLVSTQYIKK